MKAFFKDYFTFYKSERTGIIVLISVITVIASLPRLIREKPADYKSDSEAFRIEVQEFLEQSELKGDPSKKATGEYRSDHAVLKFKPRLFNPNTASLEDYMQMGFSEKQAGTIIKYRNKGGSFAVKEDFRKLYVVDDEIYARFQPFIDLPEQIQKAKELPLNTHQSKDGLNKPIELNSADSIELLAIKGVGPVFASRILKFRERAGGFNNIGQLLDVYGIDSTRFQGISAQVSVDSSKVVRININQVSLEKLKNHPYLNYYTAKAIIDKRIQRGKLRSEEELTEIFKGRPELLEKIKPYIDFGKSTQ